MAERLEESVDTLNVGHLMTLCQFGNMGKETVMENTARGTKASGKTRSPPANS